MTSDRGGEESLAPVIPLFGGAAAPAAPPVDSEPETAQWHTTWSEPAADAEVDDADAAEEAEAALMRKLRTRSLSVREARAVLTEHGLGDSDVDALLERFTAHGYLDDAALAEQLVHKAVDSKGQGRAVISRTLAQRGIPREVIDEVLATVADDEGERAREFARSQARGLASLDREVALRRLAGRLARRGYGNSVEIAREVLAEAQSGIRRTVRFE